MHFIGIDFEIPWLDREKAEPSLYTGSLEQMGKKSPKESEFWKLVFTLWITVQGRSQPYPQHPLESSASESDTGNPHFDLIPRGAEHLRQKDSSAGCRLLQRSRVIRNG